jgi:hypothetical protein
MPGLVTADRGEMLVAGSPSASLMTAAGAAHDHRATTVVRLVAYGRGRACCGSGLVGPEGRIER